MHQVGCCNALREINYFNPLVLCRYWLSAAPTIGVSWWFVWCVTLVSRLKSSCTISREMTTRSWSAMTTFRRGQGICRLLLVSIVSTLVSLLQHNLSLTTFCKRTFIVVIKFLSSTSLVSGLIHSGSELSNWVKKNPLTSLHSKA